MDVVIAGASGQVGSHLLRRLVAWPEARIRALVRRGGTLPVAANVTEVPFDYEDAAVYDRLFAEPCELLVIALGTTTKAAGGLAGLERVDRDYPIRLIQALATARPGAKVAFVSAVGAGSPRGGYLQAKAAVEAALRGSGLAHALARPSFLLREHTADRPVEWVVKHLLAGPWLALGRTFAPRRRGWWRWAPVHPAEVAEALLAAALSLGPGDQRILEGTDLHPGPVATWGRP